MPRIGKERVLGAEPGLYLKNSLGPLNQLSRVKLASYRHSISTSDWSDGTTGGMTRLVMLKLLAAALDAQAQAQSSASA